MVAVLAGVLGGATVAALAGARRTETAYPRFLESTRAADVLVTNGGTTPENVNRQFDFDELARLPLVAEAVRFNYYFPTGTAPSGRTIVGGDMSPFAPADGRFGRDMNRAHVLSGHLPRGQSELALTVAAAELGRLKLGDEVHLGLFGPEALAVGPTAEAETAGPPLEAFRVVGIVAMQGGFPPVSNVAGGLPPPVLLSPEYARAHPDASEVFAFRLHRGPEDIAEFERELDRLGGGDQVVTANRSEMAVVQRGNDVQATALRVLAVLVGALALLLVGQALVRQTSADAGEHPVLRALGTSPAQLRALALLRSVLVALAASAVTAVTAVALSPLTPVGAARHAELHPGVELNLAHVLGGAGAVLVVVTALGALAAWPSAARVRGRELASTQAASRAVSSWSSGLPAPAAAGIRMALGAGGGPSATTARSTIVSVAVASAAVVAVLCFSASLGKLFDDPRLYGWNWDAQVGDPFSPALGPQAQELAAHPAVEALAIGTITRLQVGELRVDVLASEGLKGTIEPIVVEGRAPRGPAEIMLGTLTLRELGLELGHMVPVSHGGRSFAMRVVGRGVLTEFAGAARLGQGAAVTLDGMRSVVPDISSDVILLRLRTGAAGRALLAELSRPGPGGRNLYLPVKPTDLADLERLGGLPSVVAGLLAGVALVALAHTLVTSVRRRRRELAVFKALGFLRRQVSASVAWQATTVATTGLVVGLPLGIAAGRWGWQLFADRLGVPPQPVIPLVLVGLLVPATVLLANVVAAVPARVAASTRPSAVLRSE